MCCEIARWYHLRISLAGDEAVLVPSPGLVAGVGLALPHLHLQHTCQNQINVMGTVKDLIVFQL